MGEIIDIGPEGFFRRSKERYSTSYKEKEFFPIGKPISDSDLKTLREKMIPLPISPEDKAEVIRKAIEFTNSKELQEIALNKNDYEDYMVKFRIANMKDLLDIVRSQSVEDFKNNAPFAKAVFDSILKKAK